MPDSSAKKIELFFRKILTTIVSGYFNPTVVEVPTEIFSKKNISSILLLRQDKIGDVLVSVPLMREIHRKLPSAKIDILLGEKNHTVFRGINRFVDNYLIYKKSLKGFLAALIEVRRKKYDLVIDLMDNSSATSTLFMRFSNAKYRLGVEKENRGAYTHVVKLLDKKTTHIVDRLATLLLPFGIDSISAHLDLEYCISKQEQLQAYTQLNIVNSNAIKIGINISGSSSVKMWSANKYCEVIVHLQQKGNADIFLFCDRSHHNIAKEISLSTQVALAPATTEFHEFAVMISCMDVILTPDTSVVHLAASWKIPCAVLYVQSNANLLPWFPYRSPHAALCADHDVNEISVQHVVRAVDGLIGRD